MPGSTSNRAMSLTCASAVTNATSVVMISFASIALNHQTLSLALPTARGLPFSG